MRSFKPLRVALFFALVLTTVAPVQSADALVRYMPSNTWGYTYAAASTGAKNAQPSSPSKNLEAQSKFIVKYNNFPDWALKDVQAALDVWAAYFKSDVPINVEASFGRASSYGVLGSARAGGYYAGFKGAPDGTLWYPSALANALAGRDLNKNETEIIIQVNSSATWDTRNDGKPTSKEYDLQSVIIHELGHGLGFLSTDAYDPFFRIGSLEQPTAFDAYLQVPDGRRLSDLPTPSAELGSALTNTLIWTGINGVAANGGVGPKMYTPRRYEDGSSVSHLDEATFSNTGVNSVMTPNLEAGEIFHELGPLLIAMMDDLRLKPPVGKPTSIAQEVRNADALVGDSSAIVTFDPPINARAAQITKYVVKNNRTGLSRDVAASPVTITGLKNGLSYTFTITAINELGSSPAITTTAVTPQAGWSESIIDRTASAQNLASTTFNGQPVIAYTESLGGSLRLATYDGKRWRNITVDGNGGSGGRTNNRINGPVSVCVNGPAKKQTLHIFYTDSIDEDLRYASYNGKSFKYEIVDGNGPAINKYEDPVRVRTSSNVSVTNACVANADGIQVFYRDESQGILLGALKQPAVGTWEYELVDGDRKTDGRTTGDVGFHLQAFQDGKTTYVIYDSVIHINSRQIVDEGAVRVASRTALDADAWVYKTLDYTDNQRAVAGYGVALAKSAKGVIGLWFTSTSASLPNPTQVRWSLVDGSSSISTSSTAGFGLPRPGLISDGSQAIFNCQERLCSLSLSKKSGDQNAMTLVSNYSSPDPINMTWVEINKKRYLAAGINGKLTLLKP